MPQILTEGRRSAAHYLVSEAHGYRSREQGVVAAGSGILFAGQVMAMVTASGKYVPLDPAATDGSETAAAILYEGCDATDADVRRTFTARDTEVHADVLVWADGTTDPQKSAALAELAAAGIVGR